MIVFLIINAYWYEHKNAPVNWRDVDYSINRINEVIESHNLQIEKIPERAMPDEAYNHATTVKQLLKDLIEYLKELVKDLLSEIKDRRLENTEVNRSEIKQNYKYEEKIQK